MNAGGGIDPGEVFKPKGVGATALVKYGWESASAADMRSAGSNLRSLSRRSMARKAQLIRGEFSSSACTTLWRCLRQDLLEGHLWVPRELLHL